MREREARGNGENNLKKKLNERKSGYTHRRDMYL